MARRHWVRLGKIIAPCGLAGWVKVFSYTEPRENILEYSPWNLTDEDTSVALPVVEGRRRGTGVIARLQGVDSREGAAALSGMTVSVRREQLPRTAPGEYYWVDLIGLRVTTTDGAELGTVASLIETGANDVLVVAGARERLIPFLPGRTVTCVDLEGGTLTVDWDPDF